MKYKKKNLITLVRTESTLILPQPTKAKDLRLAEDIAVEFGEHEERVKHLLRHIIWALGYDQAASFAFWASTYMGEREGSWLSPEVRTAMEAQPRPATIFIQRPTEKGSVFFSLVYTDGKPKAGRELQRPDWLEVEKNGQLE